MRSLMLPPALVLVLFCGCAAGGVPQAGARTGEPAADQARAGPVAAARANRRQPRIVYLPSLSQEEPAQRERRLARECRGLPNAGACLGHARARPRMAAGRR